MLTNIYWQGTSNTLCAELAGHAKNWPPWLQPTCEACGLLFLLADNIRLILATSGKFLPFHVHCALALPPSHA